MAYWDTGFRHIVDVDGQLLAIDAEVIDTSSLLAKANRPADCPLWLVRAGERFAIQAKQLLRLSQDEVLFFETSDPLKASMLQRLAA
ncbi:hypothetical protein [Sphingomonas sp. Root241]|uniref:hypothetical protein n=1 Tax=Sphingomonas sp. Root241 TaxID=1736501 RepID=UPI0006F88D8D|nr:hypothetical protein [Sphingomonas sp. Root241]KRC81300.1 hypothetical protein ASE13_02555 [Sphingomonas sp. Root241]